MITVADPYFSADAVSTVSFFVSVFVMDELFVEEQQLPLAFIDAFFVMDDFLAVEVVLEVQLLSIDAVFAVLLVFVFVFETLVIEALDDFAEQHPAALSVDAFLAPPHGAADATVNVMPAMSRPAAIVRSFMLGVLSCWWVVC